MKLPESGVPRRPVSAMPWHDEERGILVVCDDGTVWRWTYEKNDWEWLSDVPESPADLSDI